MILMTFCEVALLLKNNEADKNEKYKMKRKESCTVNLGDIRKSFVDSEILSFNS